MESVHWTRCCSNSSNQKFSSEYQFHLIKTDFCWSQKDCNCNGYFSPKYIFTKLAFNRICANNRQKEGNYDCESHSICKTRANDLQILQPICFGTPICICVFVFVFLFLFLFLLGPKPPKGSGPRLDCRVRIQLGWVHFGVFSSSRFVPPALSS